MSNGRKRRSQKAGLPPGSLIHIGEVKTTTASLALTCFGPERFSEREIDSLAAMDTVDSDLPVRWLNVYGVLIRP